MGEKGTLRMARQELEDLYLGVPDDSVDLTFRDLLPPPIGGDDDERTNKALLRSSTNIFTYKLESDGDGEQQATGPAVHAAGFELSPSPPPVAAGGRRSRRPSAGEHHHSKQQQQQDPPPSRNANYKRQRPGVPHSSMCALCTNYVYLFRHRCLVCGRVYCRRCVGAGMGDMTEGRKCIDCLGRRYSHRYIHRAGAGSGFLCCCLWGYYPNASSVKAQELIWAEKGPAPRRRPRPSSSSTSTSISTSYGGGGGGYSASMSMTMMSSNNNINSAPPAAAVASSFVSGTNVPHPFPL